MAVSYSDPLPVSPRDASTDTYGSPHDDFVQSPVCSSTALLLAA